MKTLKKIIAIVACIVVLLLIILLVYIRTSSKKLEEEFGDRETLDKGNQPIIYDNNVDKVKNPTMFYTVASCVQKYLTTITSDTTIETVTEDGVEITEITEEEKNKKIYNQLNSMYIQQNNITVENVMNFTHKSDESMVFYPLKMNVAEKNDSIKNYAVYGMINSNIVSNDNMYMYIIVTIDDANMTFGITPILSNEITDISEINLETTVEEIAKNGNNLFTYQRLTEEDLLEKYLSVYKMYATSYPEMAYNSLDAEYRNVKFGSLDSYKEYVKNNYEQILLIELDKYQTTYKEGYTQYTCIDTNGNYYIFRETATMQYTLLLDTYTIDIPEFTQKYNSADEMTKVGMNIEKINTALNAKDYKYIYSKLPESFKNNYFNTLEAFAQYMENTFYDKNTIKYNEFSNEGKNYMFEIEVQEQYNSFSETITKTIIMQLKEGTDFVFSFNV